VDDGGTAGPHVVHHLVGNRLRHRLLLDGHHGLEAAEGQQHADLRRVVCAVVDLANTVTHSDNITRVDAYAAAQGTVFIVRTLQEMSA
jgi:hypothetical protein